MNAEALAYKNKTVAKIGLMSAILTALFALGYNAGQALTWMGLFESPWEKIPLMLPSLFLAPAFVILMVCINQRAAEERKIWSQMGLAIAIMYATLNATVYFVQLTLALPNQLQGLTDQAAILNFNAGTYLWTVDVFGYALMSLSTLLAAPTFTEGKYAKWIRRLFILNGVLMIPEAFMTIYTPAFTLAIPWVVIFPAAIILIAVSFKKEMKPQ
jgi:hypothetical protein